MIKREDIEKRVYDGRECVEFHVAMKFSDELVVDFKFMRTSIDKVWEVEAVLPPAGSFGYEVMHDSFYIFKDNQPLEFIASVGLRKLNMSVIQKVSDFMEMTTGFSKVLGDIAGEV